MAYIKTETVNHTLIITLDRLESRNAFNKAMSEEMEAIIDAYEEDKNLRCAIIRSAGPTFSAGQDLKAAMVGEFAVTEKRGGFGIMSMPPTKPLIAVVDGQALAGGMELCLCCDMIVASKESIFGLAEAKRALVALGGGCFRLPRRVPYNVAMEMIITAEPKTAAEMRSYGFVNKLAESGNVMDEAMKLAKLIERNGPLAVKMSKAIGAESHSKSWSEETCWKEQMEIVKPLWVSKDREEGIRAFVEKREPVWTGE